ncbi:MAG TPA: NAD(+)/NADH kinase [Acidimicrobiales bacterium]|nr:NAD(+)/NADH kinase [Acidimicrobiales bacterium]
MATVALVPHRLRPEALQLAGEAIAWLEAHDHEVRVPDEDARTDHLRHYACPAPKLATDLDLAVSLGGDGTMLRTVDLVVNAGVPVMGVNVGHLGYLTEVEPDGLAAALERYMAGEFRVEDRMSLEVEVHAGGSTEVCVCLNEAVLEKTVSGHTIRVAAHLNGRLFTTYAADGLIVSTPTGSTAYNLSARGPIVSPTHRAIVLTPVSPHGLFDRSLVLGAGESIRLHVLEGRTAALVLDGRDHGTLAPGDTVSVRAGTHDARFVTFADRDFHQILQAKFGLGR